MVLLISVFPFDIYDVFDIFNTYTIKKKYMTVYRSIELQSIYCQYYR